MKKIFFSLLFFANFCFGQVNLTLGLKAWYPFSGNAKDESGNNNHPVFNNATLTADRLGNPNSAYHFNGRSNYMRIVNSATLNTKNKISLCAWVRPMGFYAGKCHGNEIFMKGDADYLRGNYFLRYHDGLYLRGNNCDVPMNATHQNFDGIGVSAPVPGYLPYIKANQWYSVIITADGSTVKLYVDCKLIASSPQGNATFTNEYDLFIGRLNSSNFPYWANADIDEIRIYDRPLNIAEITALCDKIPDDKFPEVKNPEFVKKKVKEKKIKDVTKQKPELAQQRSAKQMIPLIAINDPVVPNAAFIDPLSFETEKEIVLEERNNDLVREIKVDHDSVLITLYDNGEIDGDSITLIYNDKILTTHQRLTDKPLTFVIKIEQGNNSRNELVMYAENLGSIPPNTALMIIMDGDKRYELNVNSTKKSNGAVSFKLME